MENMQSVTRMFQVIEAMTEKEFNGVRELKLKTGINTTTIHRVLSTLVNLGYVRQNKETEKYTLTYKFVSIGNLISKKNSIVSIIHPYLERLANECGETVNLVERTKNRVRWIDKVNPSTGIFETSSYIGLELPLTSTSVGKTILATLSDEEVQDIWNSEEAIIYTKNTITDWEKLKEQIENVKKYYIAHDLEEREKGVSCIAIGIARDEEECRYSISVSGAAANMTGKHLDKIKIKLLNLKGELLKII